MARSLSVTTPDLEFSVQMLRPRRAQVTDETATPFEQAVVDLYRDGLARLVTYLDRLTGDRALADDVAQETFLRLLRRGGMPDEPRAWLVSVAHNLVRDHARLSDRRRRLLAADPESIPLPSSTRSAESQVLADELAAQVRTALAALPERHRRLLLLRHTGYSYREIAHALDLLPSSVGTLLVRATAAFRRHYQEITDACE
jgi:RNA polymerase sigma-70 factor (ECF subfamily)